MSRDAPIEPSALEGEYLEPMDDAELQRFVRFLFTLAEAPPPSLPPGLRRLQPFARQAVALFAMAAVLRRPQLVRGLLSLAEEWESWDALRSEASPEAG